MLSKSGCDERIRLLTLKREMLLADIEAKNRGLKVLSLLLECFSDNYNGVMSITSPFRKVAYLLQARNILSGPARLDFSGITDSFGRGPLHVLVGESARGDPEPLELLKIIFAKSKLPVDVESLSSRGFTALMEACQSANPQAIRILLRKRESGGAGVVASGPRARFCSSTPLILACVELARVSRRNSPRAASQAACVRLLVFHLDMAGDKVRVKANQANQTVLTLSRESFAVRCAVVHGLERAQESRKALIESLQSEFPAADELVVSFIMSFTLKKSKNCELLRILQTEGLSSTALERRTSRRNSESQMNITTKFRRSKNSSGTTRRATSSTLCQRRSFCSSSSSAATIAISSSCSGTAPSARVQLASQGPSSSGRQPSTTKAKYIPPQISSKDASISNRQASKTLPAARRKQQQPPPPPPPPFQLSRRNPRRNAQSGKKSSGFLARRKGYVIS